MPCWTYISQGFSQNNQPEVVFTVLRRPDEHEENFPEAPVEWMKLVYAMAGSGLNLETGQMCDLVFENNCMSIKLNNFMFQQHENKWMSMRRFGGIVHGIPVACALTGVPQVAIPGDSHHVIALTHEEAAVARQFGVTRVIGHVGLAVRWFPHPPFIDRDREDCVVMADQAGSFRTKLPIARIYGISGMVIDDEIVLTIPEGEEKRSMFRKHVQDTPLSAAMAFECFMSREADSGFVWKAGQANPMAYGANCGQTKRTNLGYIAFGQQHSTDSWSMVEDGYGSESLLHLMIRPVLCTATDLFTVILRPATWKAVKDAMQNTQDIVVNLEKDAHKMRFRLEWIKTIYHNPIGGTEMKASWKRYSSSGPRPRDVPSYPHIKWSETVLLVEPPPGHCDVQELVAYVQQILKILAEAIPITPIPLQDNSEVGRQVIVEVEIPKCEGWLKMAMYPSMEGLSLEQMLPEIAQIVQPQTLSTIKLQLIINVWGYQGPSAQFS
ncbi:hypothetical protein GP486_002411 [Trichoglossum hirsutum]|uniref:Uncharacterized protein n=1 Tax=Trichoglossum hirsutum TaxID=265104 RepID=A0A9P8LF53_9PEZI|nr:hypothetical protein GP486_002411 [Trichoglossum hirsutum]